MSNKRLLLPTVIVSISTEPEDSHVSMVNTAGNANKKFTAPKPMWISFENELGEDMHAPIEA